MRATTSASPVFADLHLLTVLAETRSYTRPRAPGHLQGLGQHARRGAGARGRRAAGAPTTRSGGPDPGGAATGGRDPRVLRPHRAELRRHPRPGGHAARPVARDRAGGAGAAAHRAHAARLPAEVPGDPAGAGPRRPLRQPAAGGLRPRDPPHPGAAGDAVAWQLCASRSVLVASAEYLRRRGGRRTRRNWRTRVPAVPARRPARAGRSSAGGRKAERVVVAVDGPLRANNSEVLREAVLGGLGIGLLPDFPPRRHLGPRQLVPVLPQWRRWASSATASMPSAPGRRRCRARCNARGPRSRLRSNQRWRAGVSRSPPRFPAQGPSTATPAAPPPASPAGSAPCPCPAVVAQRSHAAAVQRLGAQEVHRVDAGHVVALTSPAPGAPSQAFTRSASAARAAGQPLGPARDHADVGVVALVAAARPGQLHQRHLRSIRAGSCCVLAGGASASGGA